jgi:lipoprotein-anchoring transpeptidase ErfK/SrfK
VIYGADAKETPLGTFPILQKDRHHVSNLYHAPMPYMLRLTRDGISIHASEIAADYATHGCIGVPAGFAQKLFAVASVGDRVIVTRKGMGGGTTA